MDGAQTVGIEELDQRVGVGAFCRRRDGRTENHLFADDGEVARAAGDERVGRCLQGGGQKIGDMRRVHQVVVVMEENPVAGCGGDAGISRCTRSARNPVAYDLHMRKFAREHGKRAVGRGVIDDDDLRLPHGLRPHAEKRAPQQRRAIARRHDDADAVSQDSPNPETILMRR